MNNKIILMSLSILLLASCKKDYQKLATEYERNLPDSAEVITEQINETDHYVFYKEKSNRELVRYNLEDGTVTSIKPEMEENECVYGIYMGKEHVAFLVHDVSEYGSSGSTLLTYNLKTQKFKEIESFFGTNDNDAYADENDKTITGYVELNGAYAPTTKYVFDFDGNKISEETNDPYESMKEAQAEEARKAQETEQKLTNFFGPRQVFTCRNCGQRVSARTTEEANSKASSCSDRNFHDWDYVQYY